MSEIPQNVQNSQGVETNQNSRPSHVSIAEMQKRAEQLKGMDQNKIFEVAGAHEQHFQNIHASIFAQHLNNPDSISSGQVEQMKTLLTQHPEINLDGFSKPQEAEGI